MTAHTPGPWEIRVDTGEYGIYHLEGPGPGYRHDDVRDREAEDQANADLIAAAPELLEALKIAEVHLGWGDVTLENVHRIVRNAIAKATGTQP